MEPQLYYTAPSDEVFQKAQENAIKVWSKYDDTCGYASEKIGYVKWMKNIGDNFMTIFGMFDSINLQEMNSYCDEETSKAFFDRYFSVN